MRVNRLSGSEGGARFNPLSLPQSQGEMLLGYPKYHLQRGWGVPIVRALLIGKMEYATSKRY